MGQPLSLTGYSTLDTLMGSSMPSDSKAASQLPGRPRGSPVQYTVTCNTGKLVLYGRPSRSPWGWGWGQSSWQSNCLPGNHSQTRMPAPYRSVVRKRGTMNHTTSNWSNHHAGHQPSQTITRYHRRQPPILGGMPAGKTAPAILRCLPALPVLPTPVLYAMWPREPALGRGQWARRDLLLHHNSPEQISRICG